MKWGAWSLAGFVTLVVVTVALDDPDYPRQTVAYPTQQAGPAATKTPPTATKTVSYALEIQSFNCSTETFGEFGDYAYVQGEVKNVSGRRLENVVAVARWHTSDGEFITSYKALISFDSLPPDQASPFKTTTRLNPAMANCRLSFKTLFSGSLSTRG